MCVQYKDTPGVCNKAWENPDPRQVLEGASFRQLSLDCTRTNHTEPPQGSEKRWSLPRDDTSLDSGDITVAENVALETPQVTVRGLPSATPVTPPPPGEGLGLGRDSGQLRWLRMVTSETRQGRREGGKERCFQENIPQGENSSARKQLRN